VRSSLTCPARLTKRADPHLLSSSVDSGRFLIGTTCREYHPPTYLILAWILHTRGSHPTDLASCGTQGSQSDGGRAVTKKRILSVQRLPTMTMNSA
jgi:hypothetical protein